MLKLYGNRESGHSYKVALCLSLLRQPYGYEEIDIFAPLEQRGEDFRKANRYGEVPVLVEDDQPIVQSNAILLHLARTHDRFLGRTAEERFVIEEWLFWETSRLSIGVANLRFMYRFEKKPVAALVQHYAHRTTAALATLEGALAGRQTIVGTEISVADLSCCGYLYWLREARVDIDLYPNIRRWLDGISNAPDWRPPGEILGRTGTITP